jgi:hypothetical protein
MLAMVVLAFLCSALCRAQQPSGVSSICKLLDSVAPGTHISVRVSGVYGPSLDHTVLVDAECPSVSTWVELALRSQENKGKLRKLLDHSRQAHVVIEGEFYGPPLPDPKLPEAIKNQYHPGWGHLAAFPTKIVVYRLDSVSTTGDDTR